MVETVELAQFSLCLLAIREVAGDALDVERRALGVFDQGGIDFDRDFTAVLVAKAALV